MRRDIKKNSASVLIIILMSVYTDCQEPPSKSISQSSGSRSNQFEIDPWSEQGWRMLLNAGIISGFVFEVEPILKKGRVDINERDPNGDTPLELALKNNKPEIVKLLKQYGACDPQVATMSRDSKVVKKIKTMQNSGSDKN